MSSGITIAFISKKKNHGTIQNFEKFGDKYWDDTPNNTSKIGYYFIYYFQQKYVYIHKIDNILKPEERPSDMDWDSNRNILCLGKRLYEFTWEEWINDIGFQAPYTPSYRCTQTSSWSYNILHIHNKYKNFNISRLDRVLKEREIDYPCKI